MRDESGLVTLTTENTRFLNIEIDVSNTEGICSYTFQPVRSEIPASDPNLYQLLLQDYQGVLIGLYYYSEANQVKLVDLGILDPSSREQCD
jgi:hypothetical protein